MMTMNIMMMMINLLNGTDVIKKKRETKKIVGADYLIC